MDQMPFLLPTHTRAPILPKQEICPIIFWETYYLKLMQCKIFHRRAHCLENRSPRSVGVHYSVSPTDIHVNGSAWTQTVDSLKEANAANDIGWMM